MRAAITGASGLLGGNLAAALIGAGHTVRATKRAGSRIEHLSRWPIEWADADLDDTSALTRAFEGADVVFHCAAQVSILKKVTPALERANVAGTRNVIDAARAAGVRRLVHTSSAVAIGLSEDGNPSTESARWNFDERGMADGYAITKRRAEELVVDAIAEGLDAVIANPTYMIGPLDVKPTSGKLLLEIVKGRMPGLTPGFNNFVDVRDVARGMITLAERGKKGERYILSGENLSYADFTRRVAGVAGVKPPRWSVPRPLASMLGWVGDAQEALLSREPFINSVNVRYGFCTAFIFSSDKAKRELGYTTSPLDEAIRDCIAWFKERGMV